MYPSYPSAGPEPTTPGTQPPRSIRTAATLMYAGAGLSAISFILTLLTLHDLRSAIRTQNPQLTHAQVNTAVSIGVTGGVVFGLVGIALWIWMAWANSRGRSWARITASVLFGLNTLALLALFTRATTTFSLIFSLLLWLIGLATIILLWNRQSSAYYQATSAQFRRPGA